MIREFTVFCNLNLISLSARQLFDHFMNCFKMEDFICPTCGARHSCRSHASYKRYLISYESGKTVCYQVSILRVLCTSCGHTHAIIPEIIIPYGSYSILFILTVLRDYYTRSGSIQEICDKYEISISTLYLWIHLFRRHKQLWLGVLQDHIMSSLDFIRCLINFSMRKLSSGLKIFFLSHDFSFLQGTLKTAHSASP
jgi:hypothetical protein